MIKNPNIMNETMSQTTIEFKDNRTGAYRATVDMEDGQPVNDGGYVEQLRKIISAQNKTSDTQQYVKLQGRGPREHDGRRYDQALPLGYATSADVYVYERYDYNW